jgi:hypothetical protein
MIIDITETPEWFLPTIQKIINSHVAIPTSSCFQFCLTEDAALHNMYTLQKYNNSIQDYISQCPGTILSPGSEFRSADLLEFLFLHHHNWPRVKSILLEGSNWPLLPISNENRVSKNNEFIIRGNHKSAVKYEAELLKTIQSELKDG